MTELPKDWKLCSEYNQKLIKKPDPCDLVIVCTPIPFRAKEREYYATLGSSLKTELEEYQALTNHYEETYNDEFKQPKKSWDVFIRGDEKAVAKLKKTIASASRLLGGKKEAFLIALARTVSADFHQGDDCREVLPATHVMSQAGIDDMLRSIVVIRLRSPHKQIHDLLKIIHRNVLA